MDNLSPLEAIFFAALEKGSPQERAAYLDEACAGDPTTRRRVEKMLAAQAEAGSFLERPAVALSDTVEELPVPEGRGTVIGPYKLLEVIGEGGMGTVWMAQQTEPVKRVVALKLIKVGMDSKQINVRFDAERQALALMDHPNIAKVLDAGTTGEPSRVSDRVVEGESRRLTPLGSPRPYVVMELVKGVPITKYCDEHRLTPHQRLELFIPVCQAVQHAHQKGIIHRDLKPSNVLVALYDGKPAPKVIDFGVAKAAGQPLTEQTLVTGFGSIVGTLEYMSPEQAEISHLDIDTRSDIYSLGVLLYELLTGTTPFRRKDLTQAGMLEMLRVIREQEPTRPSTKLSTAEGLPTLAANCGLEPTKLTRLVRGELDWIVMKALEKDRNRRYEAAIGLARDIQRFLSDEPVAARPTSAMCKLRKFGQRNRLILSFLVMISLVLVLGTAISIWQAIRAGRAESQALTLLISEREAKQAAIDAREEALRQLFEAKLAQARASRYGNRIGQRHESWDAVVAAAELAQRLGLLEEHWHMLRSEAIACLALPDVRPLKTWKGWPAGSSSALAFTPDLKHYARSDLKGTISVRQLDDDHEVARLPGQGPGGLDSGAAFARFGPHGRLLAIRYWHPLAGGRTNFCLWDWKKGEVVFQPTFPVSWGALAFNPDGSHLALGQCDGTITIHETATGGEVNQLAAGVGVMHLEFNPPGDKVAIARKGEVQVCDRTTGEVLHRWSVPGTVWQVAWHPDGALLAASCQDRKVYLWDVTTGQQHRQLHGHQSTVVGVAFAPDGVLLSWAWDRTCRLWNPWTGRELLCMAGVEGRFVKNQLITLNGHDFTLWEWTPGSEYHTLSKTGGSPHEQLEDGDFARDGRWLIMATTEGVRFWHRAGGREIGLLPLGRTSDAEFHPDGSKLYTSGPRGLYEWPLQHNARTLRIGPARIQSVSGELGRISIDGRGDIVAGVRRGEAQHGWILNLNDESQPEIPLDHTNAMTVATSPDGRLVATGPHNGFGIKVWQATSGKLLHHLLPEERLAPVAFSPDGRWFVIGAVAGYHVWRVEPWQRVATFPTQLQAWPAFTSDGKLMALAHSLSEVHLIDPTTGQSIAKLEAPDMDAIAWLRFSPDGSQLAVITLRHVVRIWELRAIRHQLKEIGLDWNGPPFPPETPSTGVVKLEIEWGEYESR